jgi:hypothetical protein
MNAEAEVEQGRTTATAQLFARPIFEVPCTVFILSNDAVAQYYTTKNICYFFTTKLTLETGRRCAKLELPVRPSPDIVQNQILGELVREKYRV